MDQKGIGQEKNKGRGGVDLCQRQKILGKKNILPKSFGIKILGMKIIG